MALAPIELRSGRFDWSRVYIVGVLNVTPDSFSDGGQYATIKTAVTRGIELAAAGADMIDIGGESTRPGAAPVDVAVEIERVVPVIAELARRIPVPLSVDTTKAEVARAALEAGAEVVNDVSGGAFEPAIIDVAASLGAAYVCGHVRGTNLAAVHAAQAEPPDPEQVSFELAARIARLPLRLRHRTIVDPGLGFGKLAPQNLALIRWAGELSRGTGCPVMVGPSRKRFIRALTGAEAGDLDTLDRGSLGACLAAVACGAHLVRVHNVELVKPALVVYEAALGARS